MIPTTAFYTPVPTTPATPAPSSTGSVALRSASVAVECYQCGHQPDEAAGPVPRRCPKCSASAWTVTSRADHRPPVKQERRKWGLGRVVRPYPRRVHRRLPVQ